MLFDCNKKTNLILIDAQRGCQFLHEVRPCSVVGAGGQCNRDGQESDGIEANQRDECRVETDRSIKKALNAGFQKKGMYYFLRF